METRSIHFKSDFLVRLVNEVDWSTPFSIRFFTTRAVSAKVVAFDGENYVGCSLDESTGALLVPFERFTELYRQGLGTLRMELTYRLSNALYPDQYQDVVLPAQPVVCTNDQQEEFYLSLALTGDDDVEVSASVVAPFMVGPQGAAGTGISTMTQTSASVASAGANVWKMTLTDGREFSFTVLNGEKGDTGAHGPQGPQGAKGAKGDKGDKGDTGARGPQGEQGPRGVPGQRGEKGAKGDKGDRGLTGETGPAGNTPEIGQNGNWWIGGIDTGVKADYSGTEAQRQATFEANEADRDQEFASKEATRDAANEAALNCADELAALGPKLEQVFISTTPIDYSNDILELWLSNAPSGNVSLTSYNNYPVLNFIGSGILARALNTSENKVAYPMVVYAGATSEYPNGTIVGYIMFRDIVDFKSKPTSTTWNNINRTRQENLANSPLIALQLGQISVQFAINATNAVKATNATNVMEASTAHSAFIKELYLFGDGVDTTKSYKIAAVSRNHSTYKYSIIIQQGSTNVAQFTGAVTKPDNPVYIPQSNGSGIYAYAIVNWDEFEDGSNNSLNMPLLPRIFDINYSPTIKALLEANEAKTEIETGFSSLNSWKDSVEEYIFDKTTFGRSDLWASYLNTGSKSIGDNITLPYDAAHATSSSNGSHLTIKLSKYEGVTARFLATSNKYCRGWVFVDDSKKIVSWSNPQGASGTSYTLDYLETPLSFVAPEDGYLIIQITLSDWAANENFAVVVKKYAENGGEDSGSTTEEILICVPDEFHAIVGDTLQLYYEAIFRCVNVANYDINVICDVGDQYPRYFEVTPTAEIVGNHTITFKIKDNNNNIIAEKTSTLVVYSAGTSPSNVINVLCVGASATAPGQWASELKRRLTQSGGTPAGSNFSNINFVGRMPVTYNDITVNLEATGGYEFSSYNSISTMRYRFNVTAENEPNINVGDVYSNNGNQYTIVEINITAGQGGYFSCEGNGNPTTSGTLTKVSGTGDSTITFSSTSRSGNPFAYNGAIDIEQYAEDYCNGQIDVVYTELFGNGTSPYMDDLSTRMSKMRTFINNILAVFPNCKFCIGLMWNPDLRGGMGVNYHATGGWSLGYGIKYSGMNLCNALQKYITDENLGDKVFICNWLNEFDTLNNMQQTTKKVNPRSSVTEIFGRNGVHPATVGYNQIADAAWRLFVAKFCR